MSVKTNGAERLYYLDNLRVFCMVFGVYFHATALGSYDVFSKLAELSSVFRMEAFFLVAGFFTSSLIERRKTGQYLRQRTMLLMVPFLSTLILVNPFTIYIGYGFHQAVQYGTYSLTDAYLLLLSQRFGGPELHLWFLLVLAVYTYSFVALRPWLKRLAKWCENHPRSIFLSPVFVAFAYAGYWSAFSLSARIFDYPRLIHPFIEDAPFFFIGTIAGYSSVVLKRAQNSSIALAALGVGGWILMEFYRGPGWGPIGNFGRGLLSVFLVVLLNWLFVRIFYKTSRVAQVMSASIYTVYLLHQALLMGLVLAFDLYSGDVSFWQMMAFATSATVIGVLIHFLLMEKFQIFRFLFLGKTPPHRSLGDTSSS